jgi:hypothetical protein
MLHRDPSAEASQAPLIVLPPAENTPGVALPEPAAPPQLQTPPFKRIW